MNSNFFYFFLVLIFIIILFFSLFIIIPYSYPNATFSTSESILVPEIEYIGNSDFCWPTPRLYHHHFLFWL